MGAIIDGYKHGLEPRISPFLSAIICNHPQPSSIMSTKTPLLKVYRGSAPGAHYSWSPFVGKLEARLRLGGASYRVEAGSKMQAPRGKVPYVSISDAQGGVPQLLGDTALIARHLTENGLLADFSTVLNPAQRARDLAIRSLLEDKLYFFIVRERWIDNFATMRDGTLYTMPYPLRLAVGWLVYRAVTKALAGQGVGRYTDDEARAFKTETWDGLAALLAEAQSAPASVARRAEDAGAPFWVLGGGQPSEADATVYGFIVSCLVCKA